MDNLPLEELLFVDGLADWFEEHDIFKENKMRFFMVTYRWKWLKWFARLGMFPTTVAVRGITANRALKPMIAKVGKGYSTCLKHIIFAEPADNHFVRLWYWDDLGTLLREAPKLTGIRRTSVRIEKMEEEAADGK